MDAIHDNNQRPGFILVYRLWRGLADMGTYLDESLLSGKYGLIYAEDAKQLRKEALPKEVCLGRRRHELTSKLDAPVASNPPSLRLCPRLRR